MIRHAARGRHPRAGITLTEILISILIMGVGMLSLATLFPLGLSRLRDAARASRSALLIETATNEIHSRDLLFKPSFFVNGYPYDPFTEDPATWAERTNITTGLDRVSFNVGMRTGGTGVPVCYDPLWWYQVFVASGGTTLPLPLVPGQEFRFASGIGMLRPDPDGGLPSAHGLQRITNFPLLVNNNVNPPAFLTDPAATFCSPDDLVMQSDGTPSPAQGRGSPVVPDLSTSGRMYDYSYTWIFTGRQSDVTNGTIFDGDIVVFHNRPFAVEQRNGLNGGVNMAAGETVVEAIWGYDSSLEPSTTGFRPYGRNNRSVLLRWPASQPDPDVRSGGWIADVTYERTNGAENTRFYPANNPPAANEPDGQYPAQRCHWYRIAKRGEVTTDSLDTGYRQMVVTLTTDLRSKTQVIPGAGGLARQPIEPAHVNAALISPYVVNVVSRVFYSR